VENRQKMGGTEAIQSGIVDFHSYHCLSVSACSADTCEKSGLLTLKTNIATFCRKSSTQHYFFHTLFEAWVASVHQSQIWVQWCTQQIFMGGFGSGSYGGHLVCAVSDVTIWRHFHVSKPTFWRSLL